MKANGKKFYKYFSLDGHKMTNTLSALAGMYFWLSKPSDFEDILDNPWSFSSGSKDPIFTIRNPSEMERDWRTKRKKYTREMIDQSQGFDTSPFFSIREDVVWNNCDELFAELGIPEKKDSRWILFELQSRIEEEVGILSFSDSYDNPYLWDKFGSGHRGICIEFEFIPYDIGSPEIDKVSYVKNQTRQFVLDDVLQSDSSWMALKESLTEKHKMYKSENEYRLIEDSTNTGRHASFSDEERDMFEEKENPWDFYTLRFSHVPSDSERNFRKFRHFRIVTCILGLGFPEEHLDIVLAVIPPHVDVEWVVMDNHGNLKVSREQRDGQRVWKYRAGKDREITRKKNKRSTDLVDPYGTNPFSADGEMINPNQQYIQLRKENRHDPT